MNLFIEDGGAKMTEEEIQRELKRFEERIFHMKASEAYDVKNELDAFIEKYNITAKQMNEFTVSGAGELLYMMTC